MTDAVGVCFFICNPNCLDQDTYVDPARIELASRQCECRVVQLNYGPGRDAGNRTRSSRTRSARTTGILHPDCGRTPQNITAKTKRVERERSTRRPAVELTTVATLRQPVDTLR